MLTIENLCIENGSFRVDELSFRVPQSSCVAIMGTSGVGKTTIMEAICGIRMVESGSINLNGRELTGLRPCDRNVALVPQDNVLFPHLSVAENLGFGPRLKDWSEAQINERIEDVASQLGVENLLTRMPAMLSGGEAKRVALGRAIASRPELLCLDEALTGLDQKTYMETLEVLKKTIAHEHMTTLHITHSQEEALRVAEDVVTIC